MTFSSKVSSSTIAGHCDTEETALSLWVLLPTAVQSQLDFLSTGLLRLPVSFQRMHTECSFILNPYYISGAGLSTETGGGNVKGSTFIEYTFRLQAWIKHRK